jgi:nucleoside-diphosphate-sugar epimerase
VRVIFHVAGRAHVTGERSADPLGEYRRINVAASLDLARRAAISGVRRFVFVSSVKVNGESTLPGRAFTPTDVAEPSDAYGTSKWEAELGLREIAAETGMEIVIIRSPLVYGPGVKANFRAMMRWLYRGIPLPLAAIHNLRSLVALDNLVDLLVTCADHPDAANQTFLVSDGEDLSTADLLRRLAAALGKPARLFPVPEYLLTMAAMLLGQRAAVLRLCGSLRVDISKTRQLLGWSPPISVDEGLCRTAEAYLNETRV